MPGAVLVLTMRKSFVKCWRSHDRAMSSGLMKLNSWRLAAARQVQTGLHVRGIRLLSMLCIDEQRLVNSAHLESFPLEQKRAHEGPHS
jgi:hypothetical protein